MVIEATRLETDEEVRQALLKYRKPAPAGLAAPHEPSPADDSPPLFHPTERQPTPILVVLDDGAEDGEPVRIRQERFIIGRSEGDLLIPHDGQMSGRHAELRHSFSKEKHRWHLLDLKSTNGTFVRIGHALLQHGQEFIVGRTRMRFEQPRPDGQPDGRPSAALQATRPWQSHAEALAPSVVLVKADGAGQRVVVAERELWLGKDRQHCQLVLADDPFASARHARIRQDEEGRWIIENNKSLNGVWLKIERLALSGTCRFLLGEQQFLFRIPK